MKDKIKKKFNKDNKIKYALFITIILIVAIVGYTYSFFQVTVTNGDKIAADVSCYTVNYTKGQDIAGELVMGTTYESGYSTDMVLYSNSNCGKLIGRLYITTNDTSTMDLSDEALRYTVVVNNTVVSEGKVNGSENQIIYDNFLLNTSSTTYKVYIWLDSTKEDMTTTGTESYSGFIHADVYVGEMPSPALQTLTNLGISPRSEVLTTFSGISTDADTGVYKTQDDLGDSYYFRGNVTNNYVKFGKNSSGQDMYWRIIRINGDGTIRMIYDGTQAHQNGTASTDRSVGISKNNTSGVDNAFVGYMNGTTDGTNFPSGGTNSTSYEEAHANITDSTIKTYVDNWYKANIEDTGYSDKVADAIYCNDRSISSGDGFGTSKTKYAIYYRNFETSTASPTLVCIRKDDRFTKNMTIGNGKLTYPVGLITTDEVVFSGGHNVDNTTFYLYVGNIYWTVSPYEFRSGVGMFYVNLRGNAYSGGAVTSISYVKPVLSLKADAITGGFGTAERPFTTADEALETLKDLGLDDDVKSDNLTTFTGISTDADTGIYKTKDDLGNSYYFRGNVTNNYVKFGKNSSNQDMYWRIIRINGDGTIRMIYDGTQAHSNGTASTDRHVGTSAFNTNAGDNAFVGYMNGTVDGTNFPSGGTNSTSYEEAHANTTNSTIKTYVDNWYKTNIEDTGYGNKVADAIYCNDRSLSSGEGYGSSATDYGAFGRRGDLWSPTLLCLRNDDKFTKSTTIGNGKLTYPIGLITADELVFAGGHLVANGSYYLYTNFMYLTMSPYKEMLMFSTFLPGNLFFTNISSENQFVKPVISLKADALQYNASTSNGTKDYPFTVS